MDVINQTLDGRVSVLDPDTTAQTKITAHLEVEK
jgi:hypothetical protein